MSLPLFPPKWVSHRRRLHHQISNLNNNSSNANHLKQLDTQLLKHNLHQDPFISAKLVYSYSHCGLVSDALHFFDQIPHPNSFLYNTLIRALSHDAQHDKAVFVFFRMQKDGNLANNFTYPFLLKACCGHFGLKKVEMVHTHVVKLGFLDGIFMPNSLIDSYSKFGKVGLAAVRRLFAEMSHRDVVNWNSMVAALVRNRELDEPRWMFDGMPDKDMVRWNTMLDGHSKGREMDKAFELFKRMPERNVVSWSTMVWGYCKSGGMDMARMLFDKMPVKNLVSWAILNYIWVCRERNCERGLLLVGSDGIGWFIP